MLPSTTAAGAIKAGVEPGFPFADLEWPRIVPEPDPFAEDESDDCSNSFFASASAWGEILAPTAKAFISSTTRFS
jgi:hypothetical protein